MENEYVCMFIVRKLCLTWPMTECLNKNGKENVETCTRWTRNIGKEHENKLKVFISNVLLLEKCQSFFLEKIKFLSINMLNDMAKVGEPLYHDWEFSP